jgi:sugar phosphate isomerase/epimerase
MKMLMFSKMLGSKSISEAGDIIAEIGFDGVDLTVRPGGHVLPENVGHDLPEAVKTLESKGLTVPMLTTAITSADDPYAEDIFAVASDLGATWIKLGYWMYREFGRIKSAIENLKRELDRIEKLARRYGVCVNLHVHSGYYLTADPFLLYTLLDGRDPQDMGAYIDPGHMTVEGGYGVWKMGIDILSDYINLVAVKDFGWFQETDPKTGGKVWRHRTVPLDEGMVRWPEVFECLREIGFDNCISVHSEYKDMTVEEIVEQTRRDFKYLKEVIAQTWGEA